ncbi:MAG: ADP-forming succinate--CoA ligase subunit beta [Gammaproteobacteria bacterium]|nr:ADP-forming succinate--CoA ligase subunit beta [Gammaproteobacteria bacterium]
MNLHEYQGKGILSSYGISVPRGEVASTPDQAEKTASQIGGTHWMVKAQVLAGGRARGHLAGNEGMAGIRRASSLADIRSVSMEFLGNNLITSQTGAQGERIEKVYIEQALEIERELAVAMLVDPGTKRITLIYTHLGGSDIESVAAQQPDLVRKLEIDKATGPSAEKVEKAASELALDPGLSARFGGIVNHLFRFFVERDATLVEINPLAVRGSDLLALDAKVSLDENALFRQPENRQLELDNKIADGRLRASWDGFNYFRLGGNIGCLTVGAGLAMATLDTIHAYDGKPANFLDLPPDSQMSRTRDAIEVILGNPEARVLLINVFGGGIMRCDTIADAMLLVKRSTPHLPPIVVRLAGTNAELAIRRLKEAMPEVVVASNMGDAAKFAVERTSREPATEVNRQPGGWPGRISRWFQRASR